MRWCRCVYRSSEDFLPILACRSRGKDTASLGLIFLPFLLPYSQIEYFQLQETAGEWLHQVLGSHVSHKQVNDAWLINSGYRIIGSTLTLDVDLDELSNHQPKALFRIWKSYIQARVPRRSKYVFLLIFCFSIKVAWMGLLLGVRRLCWAAIRSVWGELYMDWLDLV